MSDPVSLGTASSTSTGVASQQITLTAGIASGDTVGVAVVTGSTLASAVSVTDDGTNTYSADQAYNSNGVAVFKSHATHTVSTGGKITITFTGTTNAPHSIAWKQAGKAYTLDGAVDDSGVLAGNVTESTTESVVNGDTNVVVVAVFGDEHNSAPTVDSPYTLVDQVHTTSRGLLVAFTDPTSTGNQTFTSHWAQGHATQILGFNYAPPVSVLNLTGKKGAASSFGARFGHLTTTPATVLALNGKKTAGASFDARFGEFTAEYLNFGGAAWFGSRFGTLDLAAATTPITGIKGAALTFDSRFGALTTNTRGNLRVDGKKTAGVTWDSRFGKLSLVGLVLEGAQDGGVTFDSRFGYLLLHNRTPGVVTVRAENKGLVTIRIGD